MRFTLIMAVPLIAGLSWAPAQAEQVPKATVADKRTLYVDYAQDQVTLVVGALRQSTVIKFSEDEKIIRAAPGNQTAWAMSPMGNLLFLRAREPHPSSSLHVVTERKDGLQRLYIFDLAVKDYRPTALPPMLTVVFRYPQDEAEKRRTVAKASADQSAAVESVKDVGRKLSQSVVTGELNYAYSSQGDVAYKPSEVFDNGRITMFEFPGNTEIPAIYTAQGEDEKEELAQHTVEGRRVLVHGLAPKFVLRRGSEVMCVWNERFNAIGVNYGTKTTAPDVVRTVKSATRAQAASAVPAVAVHKLS